MHDALIERLLTQALPKTNETCFRGCCSLGKKKREELERKEAKLLREARCKKK